MFDPDEFQVWITSKEKPEEAEWYWGYPTEAEARATVAEIAATKTCRLLEPSKMAASLKRTGVTCHVAKVHTRVLEDSVRVIG